MLLQAEVLRPKVALPVPPPPANRRGWALLARLVDTDGAVEELPAAPPLPPLRPSVADDRGGEAPLEACCEEAAVVAEAVDAVRGEEGRRAPA